MSSYFYILLVVLQELKLSLQVTDAVLFSNVDCQVTANHAVDHHLGNRFSDRNLISLRASTSTFVSEATSTAMEHGLPGDAAILENRVSHFDYHEPSFLD